MEMLSRAHYPTNASDQQQNSPLTKQNENVETHGLIIWQFDKHRNHIDARILHHVGSFCDISYSNHGT